MSTSTAPLPADLVEENLYNWLGYGNLNGEYWFIGREEYDSIKRCQYLDGLHDYYETRRQFDYAEDFVETWERSYGRSVSDGTRTATTRHYQAAFLLALDGTSPSGQNPQTGQSKTASFLFDEKQFGRSRGNHFSGEAFPLRYHPKKPDTFDPYRDVWETPAEYKAEVLPNRMDLYEEQLRANENVEVVVSYAGPDAFATPLKERLEYDSLGTRPANKRNDFELSRCYLGGDRSFLLIDSPFFGQGHVAYSGIEALAQEIVEFGYTG